MSLTSATPVRFGVVLAAVLYAVLLTTSPASARTLRDSDSDGMPNRWELAVGLNAHRANAKADPDADGLRNIAEYRHDTNPIAEDTDGDGSTDGDEVADGDDPTDGDDQGDDAADGDDQGDDDQGDDDQGDDDQGDDDQGDDDSDG